VIREPGGTNSPTEINTDASDVAIIDLPESASRADEAVEAISECDIGASDSSISNTCQHNPTLEMENQSLEVRFIS
jgi:hypothetical protein